LHINKALENQKKPVLLDFSKLWYDQVCVGDTMIIKGSTPESIRTFEDFEDEAVVLLKGCP